MKVEIAQLKETLSSLKLDVTEIGHKVAVSAQEVLVRESLPRLDNNCEEPPTSYAAAASTASAIGGKSSQQGVYKILPSVSSSQRKHSPNSEKKFNVVVYGIDECSPGMSRSERLKSDLASVGSILSTLDEAFQ